MVGKGDYAKNSTLAFYILPLPYVGDLVGWYKLNEGSGTIVHNSASPTVTPAQKCPDLTVDTNPTYFWDQKPGFGSSGIAGNGARARWIGDPSSYTIHGGSVSCFVWINGYSTNNYPSWWNFENVIIDEANTRLCEQNGTPSVMSFGGYRGGGQFGYSTDQFSYATDKQRWIFVFEYYDPIPDEFGHHGTKGLVRDNGTLVVGNHKVNWAYNLYTYKQVRIFRYYDSANVVLGYFNGSLGDIMIWRNRALLLSDFVEWYDSLRSRYGMAARSGW